MERQLLETLSTDQGMTLFVTHNLEEADRLCETLMVMSSGRAIAYDTKHQIFEHPKTVRVVQLTGCKNFSRAVVQQANLVEVTNWGIMYRRKSLRKSGIPSKISLFPGLCSLIQIA